MILDLFYAFSSEADVVQLSSFLFLRPRITNALGNQLECVAPHCHPMRELITGVPMRLPRSVYRLRRDIALIQAHVPQGCVSGSQRILVDSDVRKGLGWKQSKQNHSTCPVEG